jgi:ABC-type polysaccharide/polyol phosphate export permease
MFTTAWRGVAGYLSGVWDFRYFWMSLVKAELQRRYRRSVLGLGWSLLQPVSMTFVLGLVYRRAFNISFWDFAPLLLTGLAFWNFFSSIILTGCQSIVGAESYIRQQPLPLAIFPLRTVMTVGFHFLISLALAVSFVWIVRGSQPLLPMLALLPTLLLLFFFGWAVALMAGFSHVYFPDMQHLLEVGLPVLMVLTPIMYPPRLLANNPRLAFVLDYNPLAILLRMIRDPILDGKAPSLMTFSVATLCIGVIAGFAVWVVARYERRLIFAM